MKSNLKRNKILLFTTSIIVLFIAVMYGNGFRFTDNFTIAKVGFLKINTAVEKTSVIIDNKIENFPQEKIILSPGIHDIIISKEGYFPWTKKIKIPSNKTIIIDPLVVSQNASGQIITKYDSEYWKIKNLFEKNTLPTIEKPLISKDGKTSVWIENNAILAKDAEKIVTVIQPETLIKNVSFYKDRNDAIIFSADKAIYVIETDTKNTQNFMPIYKGTNPVFTVATTSALYVLDGELLMEVFI